MPSFSRCMTNRVDYEINEQTTTTSPVIIKTSQKRWKTTATMAVYLSASAPLTAENPHSKCPFPFFFFFFWFLGAGCLGGPFTRPKAQTAIAACRFSTFPLFRFPPATGHCTKFEAATTAAATSATTTTTTTATAINIKKKVKWTLGRSLALAFGQLRLFSGFASAPACKLLAKLILVSAFNTVLVRFQVGRVLFPLSENLKKETNFNFENKLQFENNPIRYK